MSLSPPGSAPGTLVTDPSAPKPVIRIIAYGPDGHLERERATLDDVRAMRGTKPALWVNIDGLGDAELIQQLGELFHLHRLALEDVLSGMQRPKVESFSDHVFIVLREPIVHDGSVESDQISMFLGPDFLITFQEKPGDCFDGVRTRIRSQRGRICSSHPDHLAYAIIDAIIDAYFPVLENLGERLDALEDQALLSPKPNTSVAIHSIKRELLSVRRAVWPAREAIGILIRDPLPFVTDETRIGLRDCYDHLVQLVEAIETYREIGSDLMDIYLSSVSYRLNEVMKVLTIIATIFMPLSFIASLYGMNFDTQHPLNMPELKWRFGYIFALGLMALTTLGFVWYFYRKGWILRGSPLEPKPPA